MEEGWLLQHPRTWEAQFKSGIQTIAVVAVQEGVLQLGSTKKVRSAKLQSVRCQNMFDSDLIPTMVGSIVVRIGK